MISYRFLVTGTQTNSELLINPWLTPVLVFCVLMKFLNLWLWFQFWSPIPHIIKMGNPILVFFNSNSRSNSLKTYPIPVQILVIRIRTNNSNLPNWARVHQTKDEPTQKKTKAPTWLLHILKYVSVDLQVLGFKQCWADITFL